MSTSNRRPPSSDTVLWSGAALIALAAVSVIYGSRQLSSALESGQWIPGNQLQVITKAFEEQWPARQIVIAAGILGLWALIAVLWLILAARATTRRNHVHAKAKHMGKGKEITRKAAQAKIAAGKLADENTVAGLLIARTLNNGSEIIVSWRESLLAVMGPGAGKTSALAIPLLLDAPGLVFGTSNKRDIADGIRGAREQVGTFWCFDPQRIADYFHGKPPCWWWNPLSYVINETRAAALAKLFSTNDREEGTKSDPFFDKEGPHLLARLMLAAAVSGRYFPQVFRWLNDAKNREPIDLLEEHGFELSAAALSDAYNWPDEQRAGVFATARAAVEFLDNRDALQWIAPLSADDKRPQFHPEKFVRGARDTLLALSKEDDGSFGPVTAALTKAVLDAAEEYAARDCGGRLPVPMVGMLDEAANTCKIPDLPKKYSFYPGYGIQLSTILQNWAQGVTAWGETGMKQLWAAATFRIVGAGAEDMDFLEKVSKRIGKMDIHRWNTSSTSGRNPSSSTSSSSAAEDIMAGSDLAKMPFGTVVVLPSGADAVMARTVPFWMRGKVMHKAVEASIDQYAPKAVTVGKTL